ncbi:MAG: DMT family transporter [Acidobacteriaceae bacterium]
MTDSPKISRNAVAHLLMLAVVVLWGSTFVLVKAALATISPQWFNALRMMLAFACLAVLYRRQWRQLTRAAWLAGSVAGACLAAGYFFQTQGLLYTTPTNSAFITSLVVVLVPCLVSLPGLRTPGAAIPGWISWSGAVAAFVGVALLTIPAHACWPTILSSLNRGDVLTLACALGFSFHLITLAHATRRVRFEQIALLQIGFAMVFLTTGALLAGKHAITHAETYGWLLAIMQPLLLFTLAVTGVFATAAAFSIQTWAQQIVPATNMAVILTLEPVFAWLTAFAALQERLSLRSTMGAFLVLFAMLATEVLPRWRVAQRKAS